MITFLDLLILVVLALVAAGLLAVVLMFLVKNQKVKRVCLYLTAALAVYTAYVGLRIMWPMFMGQSIVAMLVALAGIAAVVLERLSKSKQKLFLTAQIVSAVALFVGMINAFFW